MSFIDEVEGQTKAVPKGCPVASLEQEQIDVINDRPELASAAIARALVAREITHVKKAAISRHRRFECACRT